MSSAVSWVTQNPEAKSWQVGGGEMLEFGSPLLSDAWFLLHPKLCYYMIDLYRWNLLFSCLRLKPVFSPTHSTRGCFQGLATGSRGAARRHPIIPLPSWGWNTWDSLAMLAENSGAFSLNLFGKYQVGEVNPFHFLRDPLVWFLPDTKNNDLR